MFSIFFLCGAVARRLSVFRHATPSGVPNPFSLSADRSKQITLPCVLLVRQQQQRAVHKRARQFAVKRTRRRVLRNNDNASHVIPKSAPTLNYPKHTAGKTGQICAMSEVDVAGAAFANRRRSIIIPPRGGSTTALGLRSLYEKYRDLSSAHAGSRIKAASSGLGSRIYIRVARMHARMDAQKQHAHQGTQSDSQ